MTFDGAKIALADIPGALPAKVDIFVCSASYERRSTAVPSALPAGWAARSLVCVNDDVAGSGKSHAKLILDHFGGFAREVVLSKTSPVITADKIVAEVSRVLDGDRPLTCAVDITTFTHESLLILLEVFQIFLPFGSSVIFLYTPAKEYDPGVPDRDKWLSRGLGTVRSVLGYPGTMFPSRKVHLIVLVGFEPDRARKLIEAYEPDELSLGVGSSGPFNIGLEETRKAFFREIAGAFPKYSSFDFTPSSPTAVRNELLLQVDRWKSHNTIIAPMNTKVSTIGAAMLVFEREHVQITYGSAAMYNSENYSVSEEHCCIYSIDGFPVAR